MNSQTDNTITPIFSNNAYNLIKTIVQLLLPAASSLYLVVAGLWGLPYAQQIVGTLSAFAAFLGVLLRISTKSYDNSDAKYDGSLVVEQTEDGNHLFSLELNKDPMDLIGKKNVSFKVN